MNTLNITDPEGLSGENLLGCFYNLNELDRKVYFLLTRMGTPLTNDDIARALEKDKTAVYRSLQKLLTCGLITKTKRTYEKRPSYNYLYQAVDLKVVKRRLKEDLKRWYITAESVIENLDHFFEESTL